LRLVQSVRVGRRVIQQALAKLGELDERGRIAAAAWRAGRSARPMKRLCSKTAANI
jgi:hypothetical protein